MHYFNLKEKQKKMMNSNDFGKKTYPPPIRLLFFCDKDRYASIQDTSISLELLYLVTTATNFSRYLWNFSWDRLTARLIH